MECNMATCYLASEAGRVDVAFEGVQSRSHAPRLPPHPPPPDPLHSPLQNGGGRNPAVDVRQIDKMWEAVSHQQAMACDLEDDMLSIIAFEVADDQDIEFPSDYADSDSSPVTQLSLSEELTPLMQWATAVLQVPWPAAEEERRSIYDEQPTIASAAPLVHADFLFELQSTWEHPATAAAISRSVDSLYKVFEADKLGLTQFPLVEAPVAALVQPANLSLLPSTQQLDELRLINKNLLRVSKLNGQAVGRNLAALVDARRQRWLSQARVPDRDKALLLDAPITPGHTFGPAVDEVLQCSH
ncbi:UNVERIFIED_CONTAM: hypothetical protein FKN15_035965 [Acipenser sinensis]